MTRREWHDTAVLAARWIADAAFWLAVGVIAGEAVLWLAALRYGPCVWGLLGW